MKIYTKILLGMAAGIVVGFLLGPQSSLLEADEILVPVDADQVPLLAAPAGKPLQLGLTGKEPLRLELLDQTQRGDTRYLKLSFRVSKRQALADRSGRLQPGQSIVAWVDARQVPVPGSGLGNRIMSALAPVGDLFLRLITMVIIPLVFASLLVGVAGLGDMRRLGRLGGKTLGYFLLTTAIAVTIGLGFANLIRPGSYIDPEQKKELLARFSVDASKKTELAADKPSTVDTLLKIVPVNPVRSMAEGEMLQVIFFACFFGVALTLIPKEKSAQVVAFFDAVNEAMVMCVHLVMKLAPYGVLALVAIVVGQSGTSVLLALGVYALTVTLGLLTHALVTYSTVAWVFGKLSPLNFLRALRPAQLLGFSTSSSSATLPVTMECVERNLGVSRQVASFVLPLGATVNMDGTALYQGVAAVFIAQVFNIDLSWGSQLQIVLTATLASIGTAGVPGVGMITLALVLLSIGVPTMGVALILGVDRILDMFRTAVNLTGDASAAVMVAATEGEQLSYRDDLR